MDREPILAAAWKTVSLLARMTIHLSQRKLAAQSHPRAGVALHDGASNKIKRLRDSSAAHFEAARQTCNI
jgi:hypothetical protein